MCQYAEIICAAYPGVPISLDILDTLQDVIAGGQRRRDSSSDWKARLRISTLSAKILAAKNHTHDFFVKVLQRIYDMLRATIPADTNPAQAPSPLSSKRVQPVNPFELLEREEPTGATGSSAPTKTAHKTSDRAVLVYQLDVEEDNALLAIWAHFEELIELCEEI